MAGQKNVTILAIGGGGGKILRCVQPLVHGNSVSLVYLDTDVDHLANVAPINGIPLTNAWTNGTGCGGDAKLGENSVSSNVAVVRECIEQAGILVVLVCLGGGAGSGGVQAISRFVKEKNVTAFFFVTLPFTFEGKIIGGVANKALLALRNSADVVIAVPNDLLFHRYPPDIQIEEAFARTNDAFANGLYSLAEALRASGPMSIDAGDLRTALRQKESLCAVGVGQAEGANRTATAMERLFDSAMLGGADFVAKANVVVAVISAHSGLTMGETTECLNRLTKKASPSTKVIFGAYTVPGDVRQLKLMMLAIHYPERPATRQPSSIVDSVRQTPDPTKKSDRRKANEGKSKQLDLPFIVDNGLSLGIFGDTAPTIHRDQNLDIPTYQRLGIKLDLTV